MTDHNKPLFDEDTEIPSWLAGTFHPSSDYKKERNPFDEALRQAQIAHIRSDQCVVTLAMTDEMMALLPEFQSILNAMKHSADQVGDHGI